MDTGFDEDEAEFAVLVLAVALEVLSDGDGLWWGEQAWRLVFWLLWRGWLWWSGVMGMSVDSVYLLDEHVKVLWDFGSEACFGGKSLCQLL